jgi:hypothetical protein
MQEKENFEDVPFYDCISFFFSAQYFLLFSFCHPLAKTTFDDKATVIVNALTFIDM